jgi:hypothetical protein
MKKKLNILCALWLISIPAFSQTNPTGISDTAALDVKAFAANIVQNAHTNYEKAATLLNWLSGNFRWLATDYKTRTVKEIIERKGGNCFELAITYMAMIKELGIKYRPIAEINLFVTSEQRGKDAEEMIKADGNRASVFGKQHNDHRWVEVFDERTDEWIPVDPTMALIGFDQWEKARAWFGERHTINDQFSSQMIAPIAIFVVDTLNKNHMLEDRTGYYMVNQLNKIYDNKLENLKSWQTWSMELHQFDKHAKAAFEGKENLHDYQTNIEQLLTTYSKLKEEYNDLRGN